MVLLTPDLPIEMVQGSIAHRTGDLLKKMLQPHVTHLQDVFFFDALEYFFQFRSLDKLSKVRDINRI